jgi:hypothetical protein
METNRKSHQKLFYDLSEPISEDDPPKIKRLKQSYKTESEGDAMLGLGVLLFALALLIKSICG